MALKLMAELGMDGTGFVHALHGAEGAAHSFLDGIKGFIAGAVGIATMEKAISATVETARQLVDQSERLGIGAKQLQVLQEAAKQSAVEMEKLARSMEGIDVARQKALSGDKDAIRAFSAAGIGMDALRSKTAAQLFMGPLSDLAKTRNPEELGIIFKELGIKAFGGLIPVLKTNFDDLGQKMEKVGAIMDAEVALKLKLVSDEFSLFGKIITSQVGPALVKFSEFLYRGALLTAKTVAGGAGYFSGGLEGQPAWRRALTTSVKNLSLPATLGIGLVDPEAGGRFQNALDKLLGFNTAKALARRAEKQAPWEGLGKEFEEALKRIEERAKELNNPKAPDFHRATIPPAGRFGAGVQPDSLTRIGNFLGGGGDAISRMAQTRNQILTRIEANTRHLGGHSGSRSGFSSLNLAVPEIG